MFQKFLQGFVILVLLHVSYSQNACFSDLSMEEREEIEEYMFKAFPKLEPIETATVKSSYIFSMSVNEVEKRTALQNRCNRTAKVVVFFGSGCSKCPYVGEFLVYPTTTPVSHENVAEKSFSIRPVSPPEEHAQTELMAQEMSKINKITQYAYGATFAAACETLSATCLTFMYTTPFSHTTGPGRRCWMRLHRNVLPLDHHPIDLQLLMYFDGSDVSKWKIEQVWMQDKFFKSTEDLLQSFNSGSFVPKQRPFVPMPIYLVPGATTEADEPQKPAEKLYDINDHTVNFYKWNFHIGFRSTTALRLFNISFDGKSIAYEVGLAEAVSVYSGHSPFIKSTFFIETQWGMGSFSSNLWPGKDCPIDATYLPVTVHTSGTPRHIERAICVFTHHADGTNIKRHAEFDFHYPTDAFYYNSDKDIVLVVRSISTMFNYDYIFDYVFHKTGAMTSRTMLTGNIFTDVVQDGQGTAYGYPLLANPQLYGPLHHHLFSFKVDLDVIEAGNNILKQVRVDKQQFDKGVWNQVLKGTVPKKEKEAQLKFDEFASVPRWTYICHTGGQDLALAKKAEYYHNQSSLPCYKIVNHGLSKSLIPDDVWYEKGITWARYPISVTKRKDSESLSTSIYTCVDPVKPDVNFMDFVADNDEIIDEDLVAWISMGHQHPPRSEDLPQTTTPGARVSFQIAGSNFYNRSPES